MRAGSSCTLLAELEALFGGLSRRSNGDHGPSAIDPLYGLACPFPGIDEVATVGLVSINSAHNEILA